jgi:hypothetical protein
MITQYLAFFIEKEVAREHTPWNKPFYGPYEYGGIDAHGDEWFDLLSDGYELWIRDVTLKGEDKLTDFNKVVKEIRSDFAEDGIKVRVLHKYHGYWLALSVV